MMKKLLPACFAVGALMSLAGASAHITDWYLSPYLLITGSLLVLVSQVFTPVGCSSPVIRRLRFQQIVGALLLVATGPLMLYLRGNEWIVSLTLAAVFQLFTAIRLPQEVEKEMSKKR